MLHTAIHREYSSYYSILWLCETRLRENSTPTDHLRMRISKTISHMLLCIYVSVRVAADATQAMARELYGAGAGDVETRFLTASHSRSYNALDYSGGSEHSIVKVSAQLSHSL